MKLRKPFRILRNLILFFFISSIGAVIFYRFVPVYVTPLMIIRSVQQLVSGEKWDASIRGDHLIKSLPACPWR